MQQRNRLLDPLRYATYEAEFIWFDWGPRFAAVVYPQHAGDYYRVHVAGEAGSFSFTSLPAAVEFIDEEICYDKV